MASQVSNATSDRRKIQREILQFNLINIFSEDTNEVLNARQESLLQAELEIHRLEDSFTDKHTFIASFVSGNTTDVVAFNVAARR